MPTHTDECIANAARYGFCDHTTLYADPRRVREHDIALYTLHRGRNIAAWVSFLLLAASTTALFVFAPLWTVLTIPLQAVGWSGLFAAGLPAPLSSNSHRHALPLDVTQRFALIPPLRPNIHRNRARRRRRRKDNT